MYYLCLTLRMNPTKWIRMLLEKITNTYRNRRGIWLQNSLFIKYNMNTIQHTFICFWNCFIFSELDLFAAEVHDKQEGIAGHCCFQNKNKSQCVPPKSGTWDHVLSVRVCFITSFLTRIVQDSLPTKAYIFFLFHWEFVYDLQIPFINWKCIKCFLCLFFWLPVFPKKKFSLDVRISFLRSESLLGPYDKVRTGITSSVSCELV
jgi:hypothetical protein